MTRPEIKAGHQRFIELAMAIGDRTALDRIGQGLHPFKNERINPDDWPVPAAA